MGALGRREGWYVRGDYGTVVGVGSGPRMPVEVRWDHTWMRGSCELSHVMLEENFDSDYEDDDPPGQPLDDASLTKLLRSFTPSLKASEFQPGAKRHESSPRSEVDPG